MFFDPNVVEHIQIDPKDYHLTNADREMIEKIGIQVSNVNDANLYKNFHYRTFCIKTW